MNIIKKRHFFPPLFLSLIYCFGFIPMQTVQVSIPQHCQLRDSVIKSDTQSIASGSFDSLYNFLVSKFEQKNIQDFQITCARHLEFISIPVDTCGDNTDQAKKLFDIKSLRQYILSFLLLSSFGYELYGMEQDNNVADVPVSRKYFSCLPSNVQSLPVTLGTNLAGNGVANVIAIVAPDPITAGGAACVVGCVGGCLEGFSSDTKYMSQNTIDLHRNFKTGFVADAVCVPIGSCFTTAIPNASAVGAPVGYCAGLGAGLLVRHCCDRHAETQEAHRAVVAVAPMDR